MNRHRRSPRTPKANRRRTKWAGPYAMYDAEPGQKIKHVYDPSMPNYLKGMLRAIVSNQIVLEGLLWRILAKVGDT